MACSLCLRTRVSSFNIRLLFYILEKILKITLPGSFQILVAVISEGEESAGVRLKRQTTKETPVTMVFP